jgi:hypothetical protein
MREAEIKHARLAMLAAAGWPLSELWHKNFAKALWLDDILVGEGKAPSVLNGGLTNEWVILSGVLTLAIGGFLEFKSFEMSQKAGYRPGDYGFDPLSVSSLSSFLSSLVVVRLRWMPCCSAHPHRPLCFCACQGCTRCVRRSAWTAWTSR